MRPDRLPKRPCTAGFLKSIANFRFSLTRKQSGAGRRDRVRPAPGQFEDEINRSKIPHEPSSLW